MGTCAFWDSWSKGVSASCNHCNGCNTCNNDDKPRCNTAQPICSTTAGQVAADLAVGDPGAPTASRDQIIIKVFPRSLMNELIQWILDAANMGKVSTSPIPSIGKEDREFIYADKINEIIDGMITIWSGNSTAKVQKDQIITSETFNRIMDAINNMEINPSSACDMCVYSCNAGCLSCNTCVSCQCDCDND